MAECDTPVDERMVWLASLEADNEQAPPSLLVAELQGFLEIVGLLLGNLDQAR